MHHLYHTASYHNHTASKDSTSVGEGCKAPLLLPPLILGCINILSARDSTHHGPSRLYRECRRTIGHVSVETGVQVHPWPARHNRSE